MNPWVSAILGFGLGQITVVLVMWYGHKLRNYTGRH